MAANILLVEDEPAIQELITANLARAGHTVIKASDADTAQRIVRDALPDLILLDWMLPGVPGIELARRLRGDERTRAIPIIMLTARSDESDKVAGLEIGADDYITKPFSPRELVARIKAVLRRRAPQVTDDAVVIGGLRLDPDAHEATLDGAPLDLSRREFDLLHYLALHPGQVITRRDLLTHVWRMPYGGADRTVDVHLSWLRRKMGETAQRPRYLHTVRGVGIKLRSPS